MNLDDNPTREQLRELLGACNDGEGHHVIWVDGHGEVHITLLRCGGRTSGQWATEMREKIRFRCETRMVGNGYVGPETARDDEYVAFLLRDLVHHWERGTMGYVEI